MHLITFQIKHFKSIVDSGECNLASDVTVLAGKNEAGKTTILEALSRFNVGAEFSEADNPIPEIGDNAKPVVTLSLTLSEDDIRSLCVETGTLVPEAIAAIAKLPLIVSKKANNSYDFSASQKGSLWNYLIAEYDKLDATYIKRWGELTEALSHANLQVPGVSAETVPHEQKSEEPVAAIEAAIAVAVAADPEIELGSLNTTFTKFKDTAKDLIVKDNAKKARIDALKAKLPKFVLFDSFDKSEMLPYKISLSKATNNKAVSNFCKVADINIDALINNTDPQYRITTLDRKSATLDGDFGEYWEQDKLNLSVQAYGSDLIFGVSEEENPHTSFKVEQRSKGLQWFLAFYLLLKVESLSEPHIILIDEPGLYVHASAQESILRVLETTSQQRQIVFSTHSPYLIDPTRLDRIRLVIKNLKKKVSRKEVVVPGTTVYELSKVETGEKDTLTPIITAIGLDISRQLNFAANHNVILEGISDYNYICGAMEKMTPTQKAKLAKLHLIPSKGADNVPNIVSLLIGWRLDFRILLDNDKKGREVGELLDNKLSVGEKVSYVSNEEGAIEDVLTKEDFNKYVLGKPADYRSTERNSVVISDAQKVILSQKFLIDCRQGNVRLSKESKDNFKRILEQLLTQLGE